MQVFENVFSANGTKNTKLKRFTRPQVIEFFHLIHIMNSHSSSCGNFGSERESA